MWALGSMRGLGQAAGIAVLVVGCSGQNASVSSEGAGGTDSGTHGSTSGSSSGDSATGGSAGETSGGSSPESFITVWEISEYETLQLPLVETGDYDFNVAWGDGTEDHITAFDDPAANHSYAGAGEYEVTIEGKFRGWDFGPVIEELQCEGDDEGNESCHASYDRPAIRQLRQIVRWGKLEFGETIGHFSYCSELVIDAPDVPRLSGSLERFFDHCNVVVRGAGLDAWDTSAVTNMSDMFSYSSFDADISGWDTSRVSDMSGMFSGSLFKGDISRWDTSSVTDMSRMFFYSEFDGDISDWDVSAATNMASMFADSTFDGDISDWDVSAATNMASMFSGSQFDGDISAWDVSAVTNMANMFYASWFNGDISDWDVSAVTDTTAMFRTSVFRGDISDWNTSNVTDMTEMFYDSPFDGDISSWDVSAVTDMSWMFYYSVFDGDISSWDIGSVTTMEHMFGSGSLSTENYDRLLVSWSQQNVVGIAFDAGIAQYSPGAPAEAREVLVSKGWQISDGGPVGN